MSIADIIIGVILILFAIAGYKKGLIIEAFYLASLIIGIYGAMFFSDFVADALSDLINTKPEYMALIAFLLTFILIAALIRYLARIIKDIIDNLFLGIIDQLGGLVFGFIKGALIISIVIMILNITGLSENINNKAKKSFLYSKTESIANVLYKNHELINKSISKSFSKGADALEDLLDN